jgi:hypothetical protein
MIPALRSRAVACVLVLFTTMGTTGVWHAADDDPDFAPAAVHDHAAHHERVGASRTPQAPTHCAICHWLQGFRIDSVPSPTPAGDATTSRLLRAGNRSPHQPLVRIDVPSRAPPATFA